MSVAPTSSSVTPSGGTGLGETSTNWSTSQAARRARRATSYPIVCIGETEAEHKAHQADAVVKRAT